MRANFEKKRQEYPPRVIAWWKETMRDRIDATKALIDFRGVRGDLHTHSNHSDGAGTVADLAFYKEASGLDFLFVTDHLGITQKRDCLRFENVWWGQEPGTQHHHLGVLGLERKFEPVRDLVTDVERVTAKGGLPYIPHPTGWFPTQRYSAEQIEALDLLGDTFVMEIINGANQIFDCYDITDEMSIELWDRHLSAGKRVTALGNTDAHLPHAIGDVWTAVFPEEFSAGGVIDAVRQGRAFVSDGPLVDLTVQADGGAIAQMGQTLHTGTRPLNVRMLAADSIGLREVRLIRDGEVIDSWQPGSEPVFSRVIADTASDQVRYYRMECFGLDNRRAYTNAVYIRPEHSH